MNSIGVIGVGPRGLSIVERIVAASLSQPDLELNILVFDPYLPGAGCHTVDQPDHLLVNTVAEQITMFSDDSIKEAGNILSGPTFYQWLCEQCPAEDLPDALSPDGYYSRRLFGQYLNWAFNYIVEFAPPTIEISYLPKEIVDIHQMPHQGWAVSTDDNKQYELDFVFVTTGHTKSDIENHEYHIADPYPIADKLSGIDHQQTVAIKGMGLTMCDVVAELTVGRGGNFVREEAGHLQYCPSGQEPKMIAYSRTGLPLSGRASNQKGASLQYKAKFLTPAYVKQLRARGDIDFIQEVLPLLINDMEYAYYDAYLSNKHGTIEAQKFCNSYLFSDKEKRRELIGRTIAPDDRFCWEKLVSPIPSSTLTCQKRFTSWLKTYLDDDVFEAQRGNITSPIKSASDVLRDLRDTIRDAVDFKGLTEESHRWVDSIFIPIMNRIAVGPPKERIEEMRALIECGLLSMALGPSPHVERAHDELGALTLRSSVWPDSVMSADLIINAKISMHSPKDDASPLWKQLLSKGYARLYYNGNYHPGGIDVTTNMQVIGQGGNVHKTMWALGLPTEGNKFYTFIVPRPGVNSTAIVDAGKAVNQLLACLAEPMRAPCYAE
ncbi:FAD/NAD(P)-binding protein [Vibrio ostreicida]|uniref:FAD/NAD(P)-binding protein n=1 Tax=Vibrio ostreicida TaxID=526588 RepID=UPI000970C9BC|nr:FAD/NAD(P)-binding protein [Vibrio ostreicida]